ncbi:MAG: choice-of-anchor L domain-containing protein [Myxococcaceae bacterium]
MKRTLLASLAVASVALSCGPAKQSCSPANCIGCCDAEGSCMPGSAVFACGSGAQMCEACSAGQTCTLGHCGFSSAGGGGGGGGSSAVGGGAAAGGGSATGGGGSSPKDGGSTGGGSSSNGGGSAGGGGTGGGTTCADNDKDGALSCGGDCNDNDPNVGPSAFEVPGNGIDDNCDGQVDEAAVACDSAVSTTSALDLAKAIDACGFTTNATVTGNASGRAVVSKFGDSFDLRQGARMVLLSTGKATDQYADTAYEPQDGTDFMMQAQYPFYVAPKCGAAGNPSAANDLQELDLTVKVPQNAHAFTVDFAFFSAEYPEWTCSQFNDRFLLLSGSQANSAIAFPNGMCINGQCDVAYDLIATDTMSASNQLLDICDAPPASLGLANHCSRPVSLLSHTGYSDLRPSQSMTGAALGNIAAGGSTGWRRITAPAKPGETLVLKFIVLDEADGILDTSVLLDNFGWSTTPVGSAVTTDLMAP